MRVSVILNPKAGTIRADLIQEKISEALFRCDLHIFISKSKESLEQFITNELAHQTDVMVICGGDGTVNATLQPLMKRKLRGENIPPICLISSGTANDLAYETGTSRQIREAARLILEGREKLIDIIEVQAKGESKFMITNGGVGIPAETAQKANQLRSQLQSLATREDVNFVTQTLSNLSYNMVKKMGSTVYSALLLDSLRKWKQKGWELEVEIPTRKSFRTAAPFIWSTISRLWREDL